MEDVLFDVHKFLSKNECERSEQVSYIWRNIAKSITRIRIFDNLFISLKLQWDHTPMVNMNKKHVV